MKKIICKLSRVWFLFALVMVGLEACIPSKKLVYLQHEDELNHKKDIPKDTVVRTHQLNIQEYRIQPLDLLSVSFETLGNDNTTFDFLTQMSPQTGVSGSIGAASSLTGIVVDKNGDVKYAVLGTIRVAGLTVSEAEEALTTAASKFMENVLVRVKLLNFRFTVLGEVKAEKTVISTNTRLTLTEAIGLAGGLGELADRSTVKVVRQKGETTEVFYVNLLNEEFLESPYYFVQQNDVIIVSPVKQRTFRTYFVQNLSILTTTISFVLLIIAITE